MVISSNLRLYHLTKLMSFGQFSPIVLLVQSSTGCFTIPAQWVLLSLISEDNHVLVKVPLCASTVVI